MPHRTSITAAPGLRRPFITGPAKARPGPACGRRRAGRALVAVAGLTGLFVSGVGPPAASASVVVQSQPYLIGTGSVGNVSVSAQPNTAAATATYSIGLSTPLALVAGSDAITVNDPSAGTTFPGAASNYFVIDNTHPGYSQGAASVSLAAGAHSAYVGLRVSVPAGDSLTLAVIGAVNPAAPGKYSLDLSTSKSTSPAGSPNYDIVAAGPSFSPTASVAQPGATATYAVGTFTASSALSAGDLIAVTSYAGPGVNDNVAFPSVATSYQVIDVTNPAASGQPGSVLLVAPGLGQSGLSVLVRVPHNITAGDRLSVSMAGVVNPSTSQSDTVTAAAPSSVTPVSAMLDIGMSVYDLSLSVSPTTAGATAAIYTVGFEPTTTLPASATVTLVAPPGTSFTGSSVILTDISHPSSSGNLGPASLTLATSGGSATDNKVTFSVPNSVFAGDQVVVQLVNVTNPVEGSYGSSNTPMLISTSTDVVAVSLPGYSVTAAPAVVLPVVTTSSASPGAPANYTISGLQASAPIAAGSATIELKAPAGTLFPAPSSAYVVADLTDSSLSFVPTVVSGAGSNDVVLMANRTVPAGDNLSISINGAINPAPGRYSMSIVADVRGVTIGTAPVITSAASLRVLPGQYNTFTVTSAGLPVPVLSESGTLPPGLAFTAHNNGTATISGSPPANAAGIYTVTIAASNGVGSPAVQHLVVMLAPTTTATTLSSSANPAVVGQVVTYTAKVAPAPDGGTVSFLDNGAPVPGCDKVTVNATTGQATCATTYSSSRNFGVQAFYSGHGRFGPSGSGVYTEVVNLATPGYWLATANGQVYGLGGAPSLGGVTTSPNTGPVVGIAASPTANGYWVVTANGSVSALGDAKYYGDLPGLGKHVSDIVAMASTTDGRGYYLVGADGGFFTFGDAKFHGSLPGIHLHVRDVVGVVATPGGEGYLLVGSDGGVFTFGTTRFYGSLPGIGKHVHDIRAILPSSTGRGYVLVGSDGGVFNFGTGAKFHGSLPGEGVKVSDIVGIALTPDNGGYYMAGADGRVFGFGNAEVQAEPAGMASNLPLAAIAGT